MHTHCLTNYQELPDALFSQNECSFIHDVFTSCFELL